MTAEVTPGPWFVEGGYVMNATRGVHVAYVGDPPNAPGDADLIASAPLLRVIVRRLLDGWEIGNNCDPTDPPDAEWAWERCRLAAPGSWEDEREAFEPGVGELLRSFDPPAAATCMASEVHGSRWLACVLDEGHAGLHLDVDSEAWAPAEVPR